MLRTFLIGAGLLAVTHAGLALARGEGKHGKHETAAAVMQQAALPRHAARFSRPRAVVAVLGYNPSTEVTERNVRGACGDCRKSYTTFCVGRTSFHVRAPSSVK